MMIIDLLFVALLAQGKLPDKPTSKPAPVRPASPIAKRAVTAAGDEVPIVSYEFIWFDKNGEPTTVRPYTFLANSVSCVTGTLPAQGETKWFQPNEPFKMSWPQGESQVCTHVGPMASQMPVLVGAQGAFLYRGKLAAVSDAGLKGEFSPLSNEFGFIASTPAVISTLRVGVE